MTSSTRRRSSSGFTLIEIMVVIAIIAALIATGSVMVNIGMKRQAVSKTEGRLAGLAAALEELHGADQLGRYPPTNIAKLVTTQFDGKKFGALPNDKNIGAETLFIVFRIQGINAAPKGLDGEDATGNTDDDKLTSRTGTKLEKDDAFEYVDSWENPFVYINNADYKDVSKVEQYVLRDGTVVKVAAMKNEKTLEYIHPDSYQLFSMGPDGKPNTDDDIVWAK